MSEEDGVKGLSEEDIIEYYVQSHLEDRELMEDDSKDAFTRMIVEHLYGGVTLSLPMVDWNRLFSENKCPVCGDMMSLTGEEYLCGKCDFHVPAKLYDKAKNRHEREMGLMRKRREFSGKLGEAKLSHEKMMSLYVRASSIASSRKPIMEKKKDGQD
ncbi:MAG: hypothetical protein ABIH11_02680 [Candidatus Altiarchaeota archaeon]